MINSTKQMLWSCDISCDLIVDWWTIVIFNAFTVIRTLMLIQNYYKIKFLPFITFAGLVGIFSPCFQCFVYKFCFPNVCSRNLKRCKYRNEYLVSEIDVTLKSKYITSLLLILLYINADKSSFQACFLIQTRQ